ncbi:hypothetical protein GA0111570_11532 [Raineyella antarctica]|uniref:Gll2284 protein n=1 Tax=Raineyella antarctica TaxID=1577474 RepID=A0A1G6IB35_9ACTN|nr:DUF6880 family protein [Raineyella antarctica]SDC03747.1 hypothetical protein GA0111570_11532 [Raineyella antarctica]
MSSLADAVLPLVRTRADLHRWSASNAYGRQLHEAVAMLRQAARDEPADEVLGVTQRAIASALRVIWRADDSSGIIGDAIRDLLDLHAELVRAAQPAATKIINWMINFQFVQEVDYFTIDPVAYAPALGGRGLARYREKLAEIADTLGPELSDEEEAGLRGQRTAHPESWERRINERHIRFTLAWNAQRLAVWDRDVPAIIATHARDRKVAAWFTDTAEALAEIGEYDLAIDWARQGADFDRGHQSVDAAAYWCALLADHRPQEELAARLEVFRRWPTAGHAGAVHKAAGDAWPEHRDAIMAGLAQQPSEAVGFALHALKDVRLAWTLAHSLGLGDAYLWDELASAYEKVDPLATLPVHTALLVADLEVADARRYRAAARRLAKMRTLARKTDQSAEVDQLIAELRATHRRRTRLQQEFDKAGLP